MKNQYRGGGGGGLPKKGTWTVCKFKGVGGGLARKRGVVFFLRGKGG